MKLFLKTLIVILLSGSAYYYGQGFHFQWWLIWLAPIPLLVYVWQENFWCSLVVALLVGLAPGLNGIIGYQGYLPLLPSVLGTVIQSLEWAVVVFITRWMVRRHPHWSAVLVYPTLFSLFEWMQSSGSDGLFNTLASSQLPFLPVMQIAGVTGFFGVTFVISLFASWIAYLLVFYQEQQTVKASVLSSVIILCSLFYGYYHLRGMTPESVTRVKIGLAAIEEAPKKSYNPALAKFWLGSYVSLIQTLAQQGAEIILLPEESFTVTRATQSVVMEQLAHVAQQNHVMLMVGVNQLINMQRFNAAWLFDAQGKFLGQYDKRHFVPGIEDGITPGSSILNFLLARYIAGIAICRDMDYTSPALQYGANQTSILFVPAWDFDIDARVHNQGAFLNAIQNGYVLVRSARSGLLSVTNKNGVTLGEVLNTNKKPTTLLVSVSLSRGGTFYSEHPYWFVWVLCALLMGLFVQGFSKK